MPRVLRIINRFNLGGPTYNAALLTKHMAPEYETLLLGGEKDESEETSLFIATQLGLEPLIISEMKRSINIIDDIKAYRKIKQIIKEFKPDIVHTHASKAGFIGRLAAYNSKVPVIIHTFHGHVFHSYFSAAKTGIYKRIERFMANKSDGIIAISEKQKLELSETYKICKADKIKVIPLGFDLDKFQENIPGKRSSFRKRYNIDDDEVAIGIIGRLVPIKNHALFLEALKIVKKKTTKKIRVFIIGDGEERLSIEAKAEALQLDFIDGQQSTQKATITFTSWIKDIDWITAGVDIIALSSLNEGTPVSLIEAQAAGKPIVSTAVGGIEDVVIPGKTALLSEKNDIGGFAENLLTLIEDEELAQQMTKSGWDFVKGKFHFSRLITDMKDYYSFLLNNKKL